MLLPTIVFLVVLAVIATERPIHRTAAVLAGAAIMVLTRTLDQEEAFEAIDLSTIALLVGMMIVVHATTATGVFEWLALRILHITRGHPLQLVAALMTTTAVASAFLDNLTAILVMVPIVLAITEQLGMRPVPLLIVVILASNIGGTATLVGDPPNIMIGAATGLSFNEFLVHLAPISIAVFVVGLGAVLVAGRGSFAATRGSRDITDLLEEVELARGRELWIPLGCLLGAIVLFFLHTALHLEPATIAMLAATVLLVLGPSRQIGELLSSVDWTTLFFFAGLFVMVGGLEQVGVLEQVADTVRDLTQGSRPAELVGVMWFSAVASAFVDNIPFTAAMIPVVEEIDGGLPSGGQEAGLWWSLALGACLGGNATVIAAAANVAAQGYAARRGVQISFFEFLKWGVPITVLSLVLATGYVLARYA